jgi:hypothetical protein
MSDDKPTPDNPWPWAPPDTGPDIPVSRAPFCYCVVCKQGGPCENFTQHEGRYVHEVVCRAKLTGRR